MTEFSTIVYHLQDAHADAYHAAQKAFQSWDLKKLFKQAVIDNKPTSDHYFAFDMANEPFEEFDEFDDPGTIPGIRFANMVTSYSESNELAFTQAELKDIQGLEPLNHYISILQAAFNKAYQPIFGALKDDVEMPAPEIIVRNQKAEGAYYTPGQAGEGVVRLRRNETARKKASGGDMVDKQTGKAVPFGALVVVGDKYVWELEMHAVKDGYAMDIIFPAP